MTESIEFLSYFIEKQK